MSNAVVRLRGIKVASPISPEALPRDLVPPDGPAGNPQVTLEIEGIGPICTCVLNGKSYRKVLKTLAEHPPGGVVVLIQGTLKPGPSGTLVLEGAGISATPKSAPPGGGSTA